MNQKKQPAWRIALIANIKSEFEPDQDDPPDAGSEFDSLDTIQAIASALKDDGHDVSIIEANGSLPEAIIKYRPQFCFNIAEGLQGNGREAHVPALCELMEIPYTASRVVASAICLDKTMTKRIWRDAGLPTAKFLEARSVMDLDQISFDFPMFVKPAREGSGMGVSRKSIVNNLKELYAEVASITTAYKQPALIEEYLPGREFTVGFIGNPGSPAQRLNSALYDQEGYHWFPIMEIDSRNSISPAVYGHDAKSKDIGTDGAPDYICPVDIPDSLYDQLIDLTKQAAQVLEICDVARIDFRLGADQQPYLLEINTLPGLNPALSDLCIMAAAEGLSYQTLITEILYLAAERFGLPLPRNSRRTGAAGPSGAVFEHQEKIGTNPISL